MSTAIQEKSLQVRLFEKVISKYNSRTEAIKALINLMGISRSSLYRKISDKSALKPNEITDIVEHFHISLDELIHGKSETYLFQHIDGAMPFNLQRNIEVENDLVKLVHNADNAKVQFTGSEFPIFYMCRFPELVYFKKFLWKRVFSDDLVDDYTPIDFTLITQAEREHYLKLGQFYENIPSTELWDDLGVSILLEQVRYCSSVDLINSEDAALLLRQMHRMLNRIERMLETGSKLLDPEQPNLEVLYNPVPSANWLFLTESDSFSYAHAVFDTPNSLLCRHPTLIKNISNRFSALKQQSTIISGAGSVQRKKVLRSYRRQIDRMEAILEDNDF